MNKDHKLSDVLSSAPWTLAKHLTFSDGPDVDRTVWTSPQFISSTDNPSFFGRTAIRNPTDFGQPVGCVPVKNNRAQLVLSTFNPLDPNFGSFLGSQISTIEKWGLASYKGVTFEALVRNPIGMPGGAVTSLFSYNLLSTTPFQHDEIDIEFASNYWHAISEINTNVYIDSNNGIDEVVVTARPTPSSSTAPDNYAEPLHCMITWTPNEIRWYINYALVRTETEPQVPQSDMSLTLNFWVPNNGWGWAYNANLQPSGPPGTQWLYEVLWANVHILAK